MTSIHLDAEQQNAVDHRGSNLLILAGAGSGKTLTLTRRAAAFLEEHRAANLLLMTFTKKAADEIRKRLKDAVPPGLAEELKDAWIGTFHSVCFRLLKEYGDRLGLEPGWSVVVSDDANRVLKESARRSSLTDDQVQDLIRLYSYSRNCMTPWQSHLGGSRFGALTKGDSSAISEVLSRYRDRCRQSGRVDFDDLQVLTVELLEGHPLVRTNLHDQFRIVLVDEYQDTSTIQAHLLRMLVAPTTLITAVGDEAQGIYGFRGATLDNIRQFQQHFSAKQAVVRSNYRSTPEILGVAKAAIAGSALSLTIDTVSRCPSHLKPLFVSCENPVLEAAYAVHRIQKCHRDGVSLDRIAVLYRAKALAAPLEAELRRQGVAYRVFGGPEFFTQAHIRFVLDCCRLVMNPEDSIALSGIQDTLRISAGPLDEIAEQAVEKQLSLWELFSPDPAKSSPSGRLRALGEALGRVRQLWSAGAPVIMTVQGLISIAEDRLLLLPDMDAAAVREDFDVLLDIAGSYQTLEDFANAVVVDDWGDNSTEGPSVTLSTIHSAKGLEWDVVFLIGLVDWWFPSQKAVQETGSDEEERRLFYVAVTRAKRSLCMTSYRSNIDRSGVVRQQTPSRFVVDLPASLIQKSRQ